MPDLSGLMGVGVPRRIAVLTAGLLLGLFCARSARAEYYWIEGEDYTESTYVKHNWYSNPDKKDLLSGKEWHTSYSTDRPGDATYKFTVRTRGDYTLWMRCNDVLVKQSLKLNAEDWAETPLKKGLEKVNLSNGNDHRYVGWYKIGLFTLNAGENTAIFRQSGPKYNSGGIDCFIFTDDPDYTPKGIEKPAGGAVNPAPPPPVAATPDRVQYEEQFDGGEKPKKWDGILETARTANGSAGAIKGLVLENNQWFGCRAELQEWKGTTFKIVEGTTIAFDYFVTAKEHMKLQFSTTDKAVGNIYYGASPAEANKWLRMEVKLSDFKANATKEAPPVGTEVTSMAILFGEPKSKAELIIDNVRVYEPGTALAADAPMIDPGLPVAENFNHLELEDLPEGLSVDGGADTTVEVIEHAGRGKVLRCVAQKDSVIAGLRWKLDPAKLAGKDVRISYKALFAGTYVENPDAHWERPRVLLHAVLDDGKVWPWGPTWPNPNTPDWQKLDGTRTVPANIKSIDLLVCVYKRAAEFLVDDVVLEINPGGGPPPEPKDRPKPAPVAMQPEATTPANGRATPKRQLAGASAAKKAPAKDIKGGLNFSPNIALKVQQALATALPKPHEEKVLWVGAGIGQQPRTVPKTLHQHVGKTAPDALTGARVSALELLEKLPATLASERPGYVFLAPAWEAGDEYAKPLKDDWGDLCHQCLMYGAVPVLVVPGAAQEDDPVRIALMGLAAENKLPAVDFKAMAYDLQVKQVLELSDKFILGRATASTNAGPGGKTPDGLPEFAEEEE